MNIDRRESAINVSQLPFNQLIGLQLANPDSGFLVCLPENAQYANHLGTVHGSALLAVAEAGSGAFLSRQFSEASGIVPVVRKLEAKFRKPALGQVSARCNVPVAEAECWSTELTSRGRVVAVIPVEVVDGTGVLVMSAIVEWFIVRDTLNLL